MSASEIRGDNSYIGEVAYRKRYIIIDIIGLRYFHIYIIPNLKLKTNRFHDASLHEGKTHSYAIYEILLNPVTLDTGLCSLQVI